MFLVTHPWIRGGHVDLPPRNGQKGDKIGMNPNKKTSKLTDN
jgi:hypothetical protein